MIDISALTTISLEDIERLDLLLVHSREYLEQRIDWLREKRRDYETAGQLEEGVEALDILVGFCLSRPEVQPYRKHRDIGLR